MWYYLPELLRTFDRKRRPRVDEAITKQIVWSLLAYIPSLAPLLDLPGGLSWSKGRHGEGDLAGWDDTQVTRPRVHVEIKSSRANASWGAKCPDDECGDHLSQLSHMAHDLDALILLITHSYRIKQVERMATQAGVASRARILSFADLADAVEKALMDGLPSEDLLASLLDVLDD